jgi:hypothetical protein
MKMKKVYTEVRIKICIKIYTNKNIFYDIPLSPYGESGISKTWSLNEKSQS